MGLGVFCHVKRVATWVGYVDFFDPTHSEEYSSHHHGSAENEAPKDDE